MNEEFDFALEEENVKIIKIGERMFKMEGENRSFFMYIKEQDVFIEAQSKKNSDIVNYIHPFYVLEEKENFKNFLLSLTKEENLLLKLLPKSLQLYFKDSNKQANFVECPSDSFSLTDWSNLKREITKKTDKTIFLMNEFLSQFEAKIKNFSQNDIITEDFQKDYEKLNKMFSAFGGEEEEEKRKEEEKEEEKEKEKEEEKEEGKREEEEGKEEEGKGDRGKEEEKKEEEKKEEIKEEEKNEEIKEEERKEEIKEEEIKEEEIKEEIKEEEKDKKKKEEAEEENEEEAEEENEEEEKEEEEKDKKKEEETERLANEEEEEEDEDEDEESLKVSIGSNISSFKKKKKMEEHKDYILSLCLLQDGQVVSGSEDGMISIIDGRYFEHILEIRGHDGGVTSICELKKKQKNVYLASCSFDRIIKIWKVLMERKKYQCIFENKNFPHSGPITKILCFEDNSLASCSYDQKIKIWKGDKYELFKTLEGHTNYVFSMVKLKDKQVLVSGGLDEKVIFWDLVEYKNLSIVDEVLCCWNNSMIESMDKKVVVAGKKEVVIINSESYKVESIVSFPQGSMIYSICEIGENSFLLGCKGGLIANIGNNNKKDKYTNNSLKENVFSILVKSKSEFLVASADKCIYLWAN